jgi:hypothetical protein
MESKKKSLSLSASVDRFGAALCVQGPERKRERESTESARQRETEREK